MNVKKIMCVCLALAMVIFIGSTAIASTIGVNVKPGYSINVEKDFEPDTDAWFIYGSFGISENWLLRVGFITDEDVFYLGGRYEIVNNLALGFGFYGAENYDKYCIDLRGKANLTEKLDLVGVLKYNYKDWDGGGSTDSWDFTGQFEYKMGTIGALNTGFKYVDTDKDSDTYYIVGAEFYLKKVTLYFDYYANIDDRDDDRFMAGMKIAF